MKQITVTSHKKDEVIDITEMVTRELPTSGSGILVLTVLHTTCSLTFAELDPGTDLDLLEALRHMIPQLQYRHPHNPSHAPDHILATLMGQSLEVPFQKGTLLLGQWQSVVLVDFNGPQERKLNLTFLEERQEL